MKALEWISWLGIIAAVVGFFVYPVTLGLSGAILGIIGLFGIKKAPAWSAIVLGVIALLLVYFL
ncbi:C4-dicarboxylate ABC transporter [Scopulibacillus darangshiensis]|nr:C4-dicarboxylate ABC transporter [Scopulibacillus darangshiensis]